MSCWTYPRIGFGPGEDSSSGASSHTETDRGDATKAEPRMRRAMAADSSSGVPSLPETDRGDAAEARPRMGGATADKYGLKQLGFISQQNTRS